MAEAKMFVFRAVELIILDDLLGSSHEGKESERALPCGFEEDGEHFEALDLLLDKKAGATIMRYLFALILNGKIDQKGPKIEYSKTKAAKAVALAAYAHMRQILPGLQPINKDGIQLGKVVSDAAFQMNITLRQHFRKIPFMIGARVSSDINIF
jgi:hypothetical protein